MSRFDVPVSRHDHERPSGDVLAASAQRALTEWRASFDDRLEALEAALTDPSRAGDLSALMIAFARVAGDEAEATARHATLEAQGAAHAQAEQAAQRARQEAEQHGASQSETLRQSLADAERLNGELRQALEGTRRTQDDLRRQLDEARQAAQDAESQVAQAEEERREMAGIQAQLTRQLEDARQAATDADDRNRGLHEQLTERSRETEAQARDLEAFRRRLEMAVRDAEDRSRAQEAERTRLERAAQDAAARIAALSADVALQNTQAEQQRGLALRASQELERLRPQIEAAAGRIATLERELQGRDSTLSDLKVELANAQASRAAALAAVARPTVPPPAPVAQVIPVVTKMPAPTAVPVSAAVPSTTTASRPPAVLVSPAVAPVTAPVVNTPLVAPAPVDAAPPPVASPAMAWLQSLQAARSATPAVEPTVQPEETLATGFSAIGDGPRDAGLYSADNIAADHEFDDLLDGANTEGEFDGTENEADEDDLSADATGVFSTVADALRAWTTDPANASADPSPAALPAVADASPVATPSGDPSRPAAAPSQFDLVRKSPRFDLSARRIAVLVDDIPGDLVDLSEHGAQVVTSGMLKPSSHVRVAFPSGGPLATAKAKIAWSRIEPPTQGGGELQYRAGLTFTKIDPKTIDRVMNSTESGSKPAKRPGR